MLIGRLVPFLLVIAFMYAGAANGMSASAVYKKVEQSVFDVIGFDDLKKKDKSKIQFYAGSAVAVTNNVIATNCHVALPGKNYLFILHDKKEYPAVIIAINSEQDICLLRVENLNMQPARLRPITDLKTGEDVYAVGSPRGIKKLISRGILSKSVVNQSGFWVLSDAMIAQGSSGGGLFDDQGNLIGITTSFFTEPLSRKSITNKELLGEVKAGISISAATDWIIDRLKLRAYKKDNSNYKVSRVQQPRQQDNKLYSLGTFGDSKIGLYKRNGRCFIFISGKNKHGKATSSAIFDPKVPNDILIFPRARSASKAISVLIAEFAANPKQKKSSSFSGSYIYFYKKRFNLYGFRKVYGNFPLLTVAFNTPLTRTFIDGNRFIVYLGGRYVKDSERLRTFGLWGFSEALLNYRQKCK